MSNKIGDRVYKNSDLATQDAIELATGSRDFINSFMGGQKFLEVPSRYVDATRSGIGWLVAALVVLVVCLLPMYISLPRTKPVSVVPGSV